MTSASWLSNNSTAQRRSPVELIIDHRARLALEEEERAQRRRQDLEEQCSDLNSAKVRVRVWERVHGLRLPSDIAHPILDVIAAATRLTLAEVHGEQLARLVGPAKQPVTQDHTSDVG